jgi:hypothetical protein
LEIKKKKMDVEKGYGERAVDKVDPVDFAENKEKRR